MLLCCRWYRSHGSEKGFVVHDSKDAPKTLTAQRYAWCSAMISGVTEYHDSASICTPAQPKVKEATDRKGGPL